ncbi:peptidase C39 [Sphingosinicella humi]|uniref:Peptidase C39 n=2 Tax=Allosphingosinicella humi TaxID=2068657 RepID=A0A2U2J1A1_9SPHN|nr:peptidase C39 [Sphingosinicella humi]
MRISETFSRSRPRLVSATALLLACATSGCMTAPPGDARIWMGQVAEGRQTFAKPVKSWKELKFTNLVRQQTDFSCGAAALATIFNYAYGRDTSEQQVLVNMLKVADPDVVREKGFSLLDMKNYTNAIGMTSEGYEVPYQALRQLKVPAIVLLNIKNYKHFVVVRKAEDDRIHLADPALGNRVMGRGDFEKAWNRVVFVIVGEGFNPDTVLMDPPPPLSARRLFEMRSPVANAEVYDFGFGPAFNFVL